MTFAELPPLLHTPEQAAARLGISRSRIFGLLASGELESFKIGRNRRVPDGALTDFVARQRSASASSGPAS